MTYGEKLRRAAAKIPPPAAFAVLLGAHLLGALFFGGVSGFVFVTAGALLCAAGGALGALALEPFFRARISPLPWVPNRRKLFTDGVYGLSRNPMYLALALLLGGTGLCFCPLLLIVTVPLLAIALRAVIEEEERINLEAFGDEFRAYCRRVPRWCGARPGTGDER